MPNILVVRKEKPAVRLEKPQEREKTNQKGQNTVRQNRAELITRKTECVNEL